jgi:hypothetical protein
MAKRRQTTGVPKTRQRKTSPDAEIDASGKGKSPKREYLSHAEREAQIQRLVIQITAITIALVVIVVAFAFIRDRIVTPRQTVASVNGDSITVAEFQKRVRLERLINTERKQSTNTFLELHLSRC